SVDRHEVDKRHGAVAGFEAGFQDKRARPVAPRDADYAVARRDLETAMLARAEQRRETGVRIEARPAQPVDRTVARYERGALAVADDGIILDAARHGLVFPKHDLIPKTGSHFSGS